MDEARVQLDRLIEVGRIADARRLLQQAFADSPNDPEAHCFAARLALRENDHAAAQEHVAQALAADPRHFGARLLHFCLLFDSRQYPEAEPVILDLLREQPADANLLALYGQLMLYTANFDKATALVAEALRREPDHRRARLVFVLAATVTGDKRRANEQLAELIHQDPECRQTARTLLAVLVDNNRYREALLVGQQLLRVEPDDRDLVDGVIELRAHTHWLAIPAWPMTRWGWAGAAGVWVGAILSLSVLRRVSEVWAAIFGAVYVVYVIYSWTYGSLLRRWIARRGV